MTLGDHELEPDGNSFTVMDLFAGCGGFSEGFRSSAVGQGASLPRFRSVAAVELDKAAAATYEANHQPDLLFPGDIAEFDPGPLEDGVDVIAGGPPCQGFSGLSRGSGNDPRNELWKEYLRVVTVVRPKIFVMENVDRFAASSEFALLKDEARPGGVLRDYHLDAKVLNAADYGVPQGRKRTIVIGSLRDLGEPVHHPAPTHVKEPFVADGAVLFGAEKALESWAPVSTVFQRSAGLEIRSNHLPGGRSSHGLPGPYRTDELHIGRTPTALSVARYKAIPPGGNRHHLTGKWSDDGQYLSTKSWDSHLSGSADVMGRLHANRPSVTIRTEFFKPEKGRYLHPTEHRPITHYEAALIQGFPDDYRWYGNKLDIARQIGNAVPIGLGRALADAIYGRLAAGACGESARGRISAASGFRA
ncbi:DNA cytosine methyltransferase [Streptomyces sp. NBC_01352]|uniref:DNA cytosine methyltransferase n=1 Tax=Streptomyces sp. NBC_01352 TaxID=2903834 RepID=UPI002E32924C|nr:DNA cytosine methyltransferase [Streptomyces sp. NBC_01352]